MNNAQFESAARSALKIGGTVAATLAVVNPAWGVLAQAAVAAGGGVVTVIGLVWSALAHAAPSSPAS